MKIHHRKLNRLKEYNYSQAGCYFVTVCVENKRHQYFGEIKDGKMDLGNLGKAVYDIWSDAPRHYKNIEIDEFVVMPNHLHGIIIIKENLNVVTGQSPALNVVTGQSPALNVVTGQSPALNVVTGHCPVTTSKNYGLLSKIIRSFKAAATLSIKKNIWQRSFYDRVIRNEKEMINIRQYIIDNPLKWYLDRDNPENL